jgi:isopentenyldiphosphate isomerase
MLDELLPIVDESGKVIDKATRARCHGGSKLLHPVVHLHVVASDGSFLLQKRSMTKDIQPGRWDTAVGGHVDYGEDVFTALLRESREELGLVGIEPRFVTKYVFESKVERELVNAYFVILSKNYAFNFDKTEIDEVRFWTPQEILSSINSQNNMLTPNFCGEYMKIKDIIENELK